MEVVQRRTGIRIGSARPHSQEWLCHAKRSFEESGRSPNPARLDVELVRNSHCTESRLSSYLVSASLTIPWMLPLARLIYRSGFIPKIFGILLPIAASASLASSLTSLVAPQNAAFTGRWIEPLQGFELLFPIWLLIMGAKPKPSPGRTPAMAMAD